VTHQEFLDQVDAYALGALEPSEARVLEQHLAAEGPHPLCEAALARAHETVATLAADLKPVAPPGHVWEGIARGIARGQEPAPRAPAQPPPQPVQQPASPTPTPPPETRAPPRRRVPGWTYGIAAAAVLAMIVSGVQVRQAWQAARQVSVAASECRRELAEARIDLLRKDDALHLLTEAGTQLVALKPTPGAQGSLAEGSGVVIFNPRGRALFLGKSFAAQTTLDYELWLIRDGKPIAAGLLPPGPDGKVLADVRPDLLKGGRPAAFAVSIERKGGTDVPTQVILTGALPPP
jgi:anti-sigma-K factor RskA